METATKSSFIKNSNISVAIPNWNGETVLPECLASLHRAIKKASLGDAVDIVIADDQSTDRGLEIIRQDFPETRIIEMEQRSGFGVVANTAVVNCANDYVLLLNNDVYVEEDFFCTGPDILKTPICLP
ncbi:MAG: glycosyltransferase [Anaerolineales bacterium]|nr:glycosyltransferase [Anaerolineales bacterium]